MKLPLKWLNEYVDLSDVDIHNLTHSLTMSGSKVESYKYIGEGIDGVITGKILDILKHENADKLSVCTVDIGKPAPIAVVTGATNIQIGSIVPVAIDGSVLPNGMHIKAGEIRGVISEGMLCSIAELGLTTHDCPYADPEGILILDGVELGQDIRTVLGLDDITIEFEITPNRPDCISVLGLAREASATYNRTLRYEKPLNPLGCGDVRDYIRVNVLDDMLCPRYMARIVKDVKIAPSPDWMRMRLRAAGVRPINNIVDITNYVMLEFGQPMHAFDHNCLLGGEIIVRQAKDGEVITTIDGKERHLSDSMLVIADKTKPVAVAGVMGGLDSEITDKTHTVVFESANFNGPNVRLTSRALGMRSDSSGLFEKGLPPENTNDAINRACELVERLGAGTVVKGVIDVFPSPRIKRYIKPDYDRINVLLGMELAPETVDMYLERLEFEKTSSGEFAIPYWRDDISNTADLAEEAARLHGYDNIPTRAFPGAVSPALLSDRQKFESDIADMCTGQGFDEILTYTLISPKLYDKILLSEDAKERKSLYVLNPLGGDPAVMRTTALPLLVTALATNQKVKVENAGMFEIAKVFHPALNEDGSADHTTLPAEEKKLMLGLYGPKEDFYTLKATVDAIIFEISGQLPEYEATASVKAYHPGKTAYVKLQEKTLGIIGEISEGVMENFGLLAPAYASDLSVDELFATRKKQVVYRPLPKYPSLLRDIAVICREEITVAQIKNTILVAGGPLCREARLFDIYRGAPIEIGYKNIAYEILFRDDAGTITDEKADELFANIVKALEKEHGAILRLDA